MRPGIWVLGLVGVDHILYVCGHREFRMRSGEQKDVRARCAALRSFLLFLHFPIGGEEHHEIDDYQGEGDHRQAAALGIFVT